MNTLSYTLFISDLHLEPRQIDLTKKFLEFMKAHQEAQSIYILGDFFNAFIGEDDQSAYVEQIKAACRRYAQLGGKIFIMAGNRDFLMQDAFCRSIGATCLKDPTLKTIYGLECLLTHGDSLCVDDTLHQRWRQFYNRSFFHTLAHAIPLFFRLKLAKRLRLFSKKRKSTQPQSIMDVHPKAVLDILTVSGCDYLIHGHTHRPKDHGHRLVLGAWPDQNCIIQLNQDQTFLRLTP
jgi:UDP-2,3-diacylglucosamine hydrolase